MRIAISGCGITGTTAAFFLSRAGHDVTIFEQAPHCGPIGAGILLQPSGQDVLKRMGLLDAIASASQRLDGMTAMLTSGKRLVQLRYNVLSENLFAYGVHRGRLFEQLFEACQSAGAKIVNNARVVRVTKSKSAPRSKVCVKTQMPEMGDAAGEFDFVISADGSRSELRTKSPIRRKIIDYDYAALWITGQSDFQPDELYQVVEGTSKLIGLLPIGLGECSYFWGLPAGEHESLMKSDFGAWREEAIRLSPQSKSILDAEESFDRFTFARYRHVIMKDYFHDRTVFLGDAAHATSPHLGQGVNLGLEDAECFANCLSETNDFDLACQLFDKLRRRKIRYYQQLTRILSPFFQSKGHAKGIVRNLFLPWFPVLPFVKKQMLKTLCGTKKGWLN